MSRNSFVAALAKVAWTAHARSDHRHKCAPPFLFRIIDNSLWGLGPENQFFDFTFYDFRPLKKTKYIQFIKFNRIVDATSHTNHLDRAPSWTGPLH
jgi:hypothetical protein